MLAQKRRSDPWIGPHFLTYKTHMNVLTLIGNECYLAARFWSKASDKTETRWIAGLFELGPVCWPELIIRPSLRRQPSLKLGFFFFFCGRIYAYMEWIAAMKKREKTEFCERKCFYYQITCYAKLFLAPASPVPANTVFLLLLIFLIFERPIYE